MIKPFFFKKIDSGLHQQFYLMNRGSTIKDEEETFFDHHPSPPAESKLTLFNHPPKRLNINFENKSTPVIKNRKCSKGNIFDIRSTSLENPAISLLPTAS